MKRYAKTAALVAILTSMLTVPTVAADQMRNNAFRVTVGNMKTSSIEPNSRLSGKPVRSDAKRTLGNQANGKA